MSEFGLMSEGRDPGWRRRVFPEVGVRQWVLNLPWDLRFLLARRHDVCRGLTRVFLNAVFRFYKERALERGGRYVARPPLPSKRMHIQPNGQILIRLKPPGWRVRNTSSSPPSSDSKSSRRWFRRRESTRFYITVYSHPERNGEQPTPLDVDTPRGRSCCGTALG
jgi:hypothetical protein